MALLCEEEADTQLSYLNLPSHSVKTVLNELYIVNSIKGPFFGHIFFSVKCQQIEENMCPSVSDQIV